MNIFSAGHGQVFA